MVRYGIVVGIEYCKLMFRLWTCCLLVVMMQGMSEIVRRSEDGEAIRRYWYREQRTETCRLQAGGKQGARCKVRTTMNGTWNKQARAKN